MANEFSLPPAATDASLRGMAASSVGSEIGLEVAPLESEVGSLEGRSAAAVEDINKLFSTLQPSVEASAKRVGEYNTGLLSMERNIFDAALDRMNQFRQARAAEAQALSQKLGAPVPIQEFTFDQDIEAQLAPQDFAGSMLHSMGYAQAGVGEAEAFAGRVFPLIRKEETLKTQRYFADQITSLRKEIAAIKASKAGRVNERFLELRQAEREYRLARFEAQQRTLETKLAIQQRKDELKADKQRLALEKAQLLGYTWRRVPVKGKKYKYKMIKVPTLAARTTELDETFRRDQLDQEKTLTERELAIRERENQIAHEEYLTDRQSGALELLNDAMNPSSSGSGTYTETRLVTVMQKNIGGKTDKERQAQANQIANDLKFLKTIPADATYRLHKKKDGSWEVVFEVTKDVKTPVASSTGYNLTDPNDAVDYLVAGGYSRRLAVRVVRARFGLPDSWTYGKKPGKK